MKLNTDATYDCLFVGDALQRRFGSFAAPEIHLFCYLGCLLLVYDHRPSADWGYTFVSTEVGAPFSLVIDQTVTELHRRGLLLDSQDQLVIADEALNELNLMSTLSVGNLRREYLTAATSSVLALSAGIVRTALSEEPELKRAAAVSAKRELLREPGIRLIHEHFSQLRTALGDEQYDLRIPAVAWLTALFTSAATESHT